MPGKIHGRITQLLLNGSNISNYFNNAADARTVETAETSAFGDTDKSYVVGRRDATIKLGGFFDATAGATGIDTILDTIRQAATRPIVSVITEPGINGRGRSGPADEIGVQKSSPIGGVVTLAGDFQVSQIDPTKTILPLGTLGTSTSPSGTTEAYNGGTDTGLGAIGYLQVGSVVSGTPVFLIEHSEDGSTSWGTLITFAGVAAAGAPSAQRAAVTGTVKPFKRITVSAGTAVAWCGIAQPIA